jgi:uncharacterized oxidoreductase
MFLVMCPQRFAGVRHLNQEVTQLERYVRGVPLIEGVDRINLPGDPERSVRSRRQAGGIPIDNGNWSALSKLAGEFGIVPPRGKSVQGH